MVAQFDIALTRVLFASTRFLQIDFTILYVEFNTFVNICLDNCQVTESVIILLFLHEVEPSTKKGL